MWLKSLTDSRLTGADRDAFEDPPSGIRGKDLSNQEPHAVQRDVEMAIFDKTDTSFVPVGCPLFPIPVNRLNDSEIVNDHTTVEWPS